MRLSSRLVVATVIAVMLWLAAKSDRLGLAFASRAEFTNYYAYLVEGMEAGQVSLNFPVDPHLLAPPADDGRGRYALQDASLYHGKYYIYFGVVPAALLLLPYHHLTGQHLPGNDAVLIFVAAGFLLQAILLSSARKRYFPGLSAGLEAVLLLVLAFGAVTPELLAKAGMYEIAIAGAYCFVSAAALSLLLALRSDRSPLRPLTAASLATALAVGCRPDMVLVLPLVAALAWVIQRRQPARRGKIICAAVLPAFAIGLLLMAYNFARFDRPFEFGDHYQLSVGNVASGQLAQTRFLLPNLEWYYFSAPNLTPYFPYFLPLETGPSPEGYVGREIVHGQWIVLALGLWVGVMAVRARRRGRGVAPGLFTLILLLLATATLLLLTTAVLGIRADRYQVDFQTPLIVGLVLAGGALAVGETLPGRAGLVILGLAAAAYNLLFPFSATARFMADRPATFRAVSILGNYPSAWAAQLGWIHYGPRRLTLQLAKDHPSSLQPLITTGSTAGRDSLAVLQHAGGQVEFYLSHGEEGTFKSNSLFLDLTRPHVLEVDMGSFYPPRFHPYFSDWSDADIDSAKNVARVQIDGAQIIRSRTAFFDSPPGALAVGTNPQDPADRFAGRIVSFQRLPLRDWSHDPSLVEPGIWRVSIDPGLAQVGLSQPLLASGKAGAGNEIFLRILPDNRISFGVDSWGYGAKLSPPMATTRGLHVLELFVGSQVLKRSPERFARLSEPERLRLRDRIALWWDGRCVATFAMPAHQDTFDSISLGANSQGFSSTGSIFEGVFLLKPYVAGEAEAFVARNLAQPVTP